jgi:hypothetical protein
MTEQTPCEESGESMPAEVPCVLRDGWSAHESVTGACLGCGHGRWVHVSDDATAVA